MKTLRYAFWAIVGLCLIMVGVANRDPVTLHAFPEFLTRALGIAPAIELPLFVAIYIVNRSPTFPRMSINLILP